MTTLPALSQDALHLAHHVSKNLGSPAHARVAYALLVHPQIRGKRAIALGSGLNERTVEDLVPWTAGEVVGFLRCTQTGTSGPEHDEPKKTAWEVVQPNRNGLPQEEVLPLVVVLDQEGVALPGPQEDLAHARTTGVVRSGSGLDPSLDVWADTRAGSGGVGTSGWALCLLALAGMLGKANAEGQIEVGGRDAAAALGMTDRGVSKVFDRMQAASLGWRERGRFVLLPQMLDEGMQGQGRSDRRRDRHEREAKAFHDPQTKFARRDFLKHAATYNPELDSAGLEALWVQEQALRVGRAEMQVRLFEGIWAQLDAEGTPAPVERTPTSISAQEADRSAAFADFLARLRPAS